MARGRIHEVSRCRRYMVDLSTAMAAAGAERGKRQKGDKDKRGKSGRKHGLEPFDPQKYVAKEKADTASMWLVLFFALLIGSITRFIFMPNLDGSGGNDLLWVAPLAMIILIPAIHRHLMPQSFVEHYTKGTWFKAGFLYTFTWLAVSFLLTNPPFGDIGSPEPSAGWTIILEDGSDWYMPQDNLTSKNTIFWEATDGSDDPFLAGEAWLLFAIADNADPNDANFKVSISKDGENSTELNISESEWDRMMAGRISATEASVNSSIESHDVVLVDNDADRPIAINLGEDLGVGIYSISFEVTEQGEPWVNTNSWTWKLIITEQEA